MLFGLLLSGQAFAVETYVAKTVIPTASNPSAPKGVPIKSTASYYSLKQDENIPIKASRPEFRIPNPLDELFLKKLRLKRAMFAKREAVKKKDDLVIDSDDLTYQDETKELTAVGNVVITSSDGTIINTDRAVYDKDANTVKLYDNIVMLQELSRIESDHAFVDLNEEAATIDAPVTTVGSNIKILSEEGYAYPDRIEGVNGTIELANKTNLRFQTAGFDHYREMSMTDEEYYADAEAFHTTHFKLKAKEIEVDPTGEYNTLVLKDTDLLYKDFKLLSVDSIEIFTDKDKTFVEANLPIEFGSLNDFGTYAAMGYIFKLPGAKTLSISPALVHKNKLGLGFLGRFRSKRLDLQGGWATSNENLVVKGIYKFKNGFMAQFGRHSYEDEWFIGSRRPGYYAQLSYTGNYPIEDLDATFSQRFMAGYASKYVKKHQENNNYGTMRFRWQGQLAKVFKRIENKEQGSLFELGGLAQTMATVYGTGQTVGIFRVGPYIRTKFKNWRSRIFYAQSGVHGESPLRFDEYTYGKSTFEIDESMKLCKYLTVGYRGNISPLRDNHDKDLMTENSFYVVAGPSDFKVAFSYDTLRSNMYLDFMFLVGSDSAKMHYDKIVVKDPNKINVKEPYFGRDFKYRKIKVPDNL